MKSTVAQQIQLAEIVSSLYGRGNTDLASDIVALTASYNGTHVLFDDKNMDSVFMQTLHELLDKFGFDSIMKLSREKAEQISKAPAPFDPSYAPMNTTILNWH